MTGFASMAPVADVQLDPPELEALDSAVQVLRGKRLAVLTGAGLSTDSGIPDYRGPGSAPRNPMTYQEFIGSEANRRRYWARLVPSPACRPQCRPRRRRPDGTAGPDDRPDYPKRRQAA
jgi:hypothetical protein